LSQERKRCNSNLQISTLKVRAGTFASAVKQS